MKKLIAALVLTSAAVAAPAFSAVGVSIHIGEPGFYGQLEIEDGYRPRLVNTAPPESGSDLPARPRGASAQLEALLRAV
jgi:hypothetical protein